MPQIPQPIPCIDCKNQLDIMSVVASGITQGFGNATPTQSQVVVAGNNATLVSSGTYQLVMIQNTGTPNLAVRLASGAESSLANGEIVVPTNGMLVIRNFIGIVTGACSTTTNVSVTRAT